MGVDKETIPNWFNIVIDDNPKHLNDMRKQAEDDFTLLYLNKRLDRESNSGLGIDNAIL